MGAINNIEKLNDLPVTLAELGGVTSAQVTAIVNAALAGVGGGSASSNRIINGGMQVVQRGASFSQTGNNTIFTADRWYMKKRGMPGGNIDGASVLNHQNSTESAFYSGPRFLRAQIFNNYTSQVSGNNSIIVGTKLAYNSIADLRGRAFTLKFKMRADRTGFFPVIFRYGSRSYMVAVQYNGGYQELTVQVPGGIVPEDIISDLKVEFVLFSGTAARVAEFGNLDTWQISAADGFTTSQNLVQGFGEAFDLSDVVLQAGLSADFQLRSLEEETLTCMQFFKTVRVYHQWSNQLASQAVTASISVGVSGTRTALVTLDGSNHSNVQSIATSQVVNGTFSVSGSVVANGACTIDATYDIDMEDYT